AAPRRQVPALGGAAHLFPIVGRADHRLQRVPKPVHVPVADDAPCFRADAPGPRTPVAAQSPTGDGVNAALPQISVARLPQLVLRTHTHRTESTDIAAATDTAAHADDQRAGAADGPGVAAGAADPRAGVGVA